MLLLSLLNYLAIGAIVVDGTFLSLMVGFFAPNIIDFIPFKKALPYELAGLNVVYAEADCSFCLEDVAV